MSRSFRWWALAAVFAAGCASAQQPAPATPQARPATPENPNAVYASTYHPLPSRTTLIRNATILTAAGPRIEGGSVLIRDGKIAAVGRDITAPADAVVIDGTGKWVTPGLIDDHSHLGVYAAPGGQALSDGNEATNPNTADVWAEHSVWPQDPQFALALAGGVTSIQILPGSANLFGGRTVVVKNVPARTVQDMKFPGAPYGLKMACGENPKRVYQNRGPSTRMGNIAGYREAFIQAQDYRDRMQQWRENGADPSKRPTRNLKLETLAGALNGDILVHWHCYRADDMAEAMAVAREFHFHISTFEHAVEAYKIPDLLKQAGVCANMWADWWGFKQEAYDGIQQNAALVNAAGACAIIHSDSPDGIQRLNQESGKAIAAGRRIGVDVPYEDAIKWTTINPATALGIGDQTGSLEQGKMGDVVLWTGDPFSVYSHAEKVFIDGALVYDRDDPSRQPVSDFLVGNEPGQGEGRQP
jgi:imidazolonepropionase-like amidohydrolase